MTMTSAQSWKAEFSRAVDARPDDLRRKRHYEAQVEERRELDQKLNETTMDNFVDVLVLATAEQIAEFSAELDRYDAATVEAIMENQQKLEKIQAELRDKLARAYVLPDGRRVFKSADGMRAYDEFGEELKPEAIDPDTIENWRPRYEEYLGDRRTEKSLIQERSELEAFDKCIQEARERKDEADLTAKELEEVRKDLADNMPAAVKRRLSIEPDAPAADLEVPRAVMDRSSVRPGLSLDLQ